MPADNVKVWRRFFDARSWLVLVFFALLVLSLRLSAFYQSIVGLDWDDSLYLLVADRWLNGDPPYTAIWDNKPPGIYLLFAGALAIVGHSVVAIRILAWLFVTVTCWLLYRLGQVIPREGTTIGLAAGSLYAVASTNSGGLSSNTELFFTPFVVFAVYLLLSQKWLAPAKLSPELPPCPPNLGGSKFKSPPNLGDLGGKRRVSESSPEPLYSSNLGSSQVQSPPHLGDLTGNRVSDGVRSSLRPSFSQQIGAREFLSVFLMGLSLGIGLVIKQVVLFDFAAISLLLGAGVLLQGRSPARYVSLLKLYGLLLIGFILPFLLFSLYFLAIGHFGDYVYANFTANRLRTVDNAFSPMLLLEAIREQLLQPNLNVVFWLSALAAPIYIVINRRTHSRERWIIVSLVVWFVFILLGFCVVFRLIFFGHYFLQLTPVLSLMTAYMLTRLLLANDRESPDWKQRFAILASALLIVTIAQTKSNLKQSARYVYYRQIRQVSHWQDTPAAVAAYLKARLAPTDSIYVADDQPVIYFLTRAKVPTRYAFPSFLIPGPGLPNITGVKPLEELDRIMQQQPAYVIKQKGYNSRIEIGNNRAYYQRLNQFLNQDYRLEHTINSTELYRRDRS